MDIVKLRDSIKKNKIGYLILYIFSIIYILIFKINKFILFNFYSNKFSKPIICIGNISAGGSGKTSFVISLSEKLRSIGINHVISLRGYKSKYKNKIIDSKKINVTDDENCSDEHKLIVLATKNSVPVIASYDRVFAIKYSISKYNPSIVIMDDGFQNFKIKKDLNIVVLNLNSFNDKILPLGNLRESYSGLRRADFVVLNHCELFDEKKIEEVVSYLTKYIKKDKIIKAKYILKGFLNLIDGSYIEIEKFKGEKVSAFCGLGDNRQFKNFLEMNGLKVSLFWYFEDHHNYNIKDLISIKNLSGDLSVLTTYKDAVKFMKDAKKIFDKIYAVDIEMKYNDNIIIEEIKKFT
mgnify:CR=1 FL=1